MFCENCGTQVPDDAKFCPNCGQVFEGAADTTPAAPVPEVQPQQPQQPVMQQPQAFVPGQQQPYMSQPMGEKPKKKAPGFLIPLLLIIAIVALIAVVAVMLLSSSGSGSAKNGAKLYEVSSKNGVVFIDEAFYDMKGGSEDVDERVYGKYSMDASMYVYTDSDDDLYFIKNDLKAEKIGKDVADADNVLLSTDSNIIAYQDRSSNLYYYNVKNGSSEKVAKDVNYNEFALAPNGKTLAYVDEDSDLYLYDGKESVKIEKKVDNVIAVFSANRVFFRKSDKLYLYNGKESNKVLSDYRNASFNADGSQILYNDDSEKVYLYNVRKDESTKIGKGYLYGIYAPEGYSLATKVRAGAYTYAYMVPSFKNQVVGTGTGLYWVNDKQTDMIKIASDNTYYVYISKSGKSMVYLEGNKLYYVPKLGEKMEEKQLAKNVDEVVVSRDLSKIYYANDDEIYFVTTSGKETRITDDYEEEGFAFNNANGTLYVIIDDDLYKAGTKEDSLEKIEKDIEFVTSGNSPYFYGVVYGNYDDEYYYLEKGKPTKFN